MLEVFNLSKQFGSLVAVNQVDFSVKRGETVVIMGPSGCGKSTTIRSLNRLVEPDQGRVLLDGVDVLAQPVDELRRLRQRIGFVFQQFQLIGRLTAQENVMFSLVLNGMEREMAAIKAETALRRVGMERYIGHRPQELSGGQQQRVAIARALAADPPLMLWDEPTAALDPMLVQEVLVIMEELAQEHTTTMVVVTHELAFAMHAADRILLMDKGSIVESGTPAQVFGAPQTEVGQRYQDLLTYQLRSGRELLRSS